MNEIKHTPEGQMICPEHGDILPESRFDTTFRSPDEEEQLFFAVPGRLCKPSHQLYIDCDLFDTLGVNEGGRCVFAIENDKASQERNASGEPPSHSS